MQPLGTKKLIRDSFYKLLATSEDIDSISVSKIIKEAGISRPTFYYHFQDIYALQAWIIKTSFAEMIEKMARDKICRCEVEAFFDYLDQYRVLIYKCLQSSRWEIVEDIIEQNIFVYIYNFLALNSLGKNLPQEDFDFTIEFYSRAVANMCIKYVSGRYSKIGRDSVIDMVNRLIEREISTLK